jgi:hypothetical protein
MKSLTKREKTMISRSDVACTVIVNIYLPNEDDSRAYKRKAEFLCMLNDEQKANRIAYRIQQLIKEMKIQLIGEEIKDG